jgi:putative ABC transport system substrate-binding protein
MRRRDFIGLSGGAAAAIVAPRMAWAQPAKMPRVGVLLYSNPQADPNAESFRRGMRELGYVEGRNIAIEYHAAEGKPERLPELAAELVRGKPDLVFSLGGDVTVFAAAATQTIPLVFIASGDPVQHGFVRSLARPGGNATGVTLLLDELASKRLELLKEAAPRVSRVAFLFNPNHPDNELREAERAAGPLGVRLQPLPLRGPGELDGALRAARDERADALYVVSDRFTVGSLRKLVAFAADNRLPLAGGWGAWAQAGGLLSYGPNVDDMVRRATGYVDKILKGAKPDELPVQQPTKFELFVNLKTAKALELAIPESFLLRADKVIE